MILNKLSFFKKYRQIFGKLKQKQVNGLNLILDYCVEYEDDMPIEHIAYILATAKWESANTFQPIKEYRASVKQSKLRKIQDNYWYSGYYGRGLVQLTWKKNYKLFSNILEIDLIGYPNLALDPYISMIILVTGMRKGLFTGRALFFYLNDKKTDYINARRVVNGTDHAKQIAKIAIQMERCLK